ncbi:unnamed protein product [Rhizophagus irregularis]|nr:unnamed protein product [Rhizophagus irregularis]
MSDVWEYFQKIRNDNNVIISFNCQLYKTEYEVLTSTTILRRHLRSIHASTYVYGPNLLSQNSSYTSAKQKHITTKLTQWVTVDLQSFTVVEQEQEQFQELIYTLDSRYILPYRQTLKEERDSIQQH